MSLLCLAAIPAWRGWSRRQLGWPPTSGTTSPRSRTVASAGIMARSSQPPLPKPPSTSSSADALPRSSRFSGRRKGPIGSCRPEPAPSMTRFTTCSPAGIRPCPPTVSSPPHSLPQLELPYGFWCSPLDIFSSSTAKTSAETSSEIRAIQPDR
jgi:hypothetical protein